MAAHIRSNSGPSALCSTIAQINQMPIHTRTHTHIHTHAHTDLTHTLMSHTLTHDFVFPLRRSQLGPQRCRVRRAAKERSQLGPAHNTERIRQERVLLSQRKPHISHTHAHMPKQRSSNPRTGVSFHTSELAHPPSNTTSCHRSITNFQSANIEECRQHSTPQTNTRPNRRNLSRVQSDT